MNQTAAFLLTILPILVILAMLIIWRKPADITGVVGWAAVCIVAMLFFRTGISVVIRSSLVGLISSFSVSLMVAASLLQITVMQKTGALRRVIIFIKTISTEDKAASIMIINIGFGILMVSVGATPVSVLPPILLAMGYSTYIAIVLPAIGYDALCTYALLGAPIVAFVDVANAFFKDQGIVLTPSDVGRVFFMFLPVVSTLIGFSMLWIVGKWAAVKKGVVPVLISGVVITITSYFTNRVDNFVTLTGIICGAAVILVMAAYLKLRGKKLFDRSILTADEIAFEKEMPLWRAFMPWILLTAIILILNVPKPIFNELYYKLLMPVTGLAADGSPVKTRALWSAYTWLVVSTIIALPFLKVKKGVISDSLRTWLKRAPRPVFAAAIFFSIGSVMQMSGYDPASKAYVVPSMVKTLADVSATTFHTGYAFISSFVGLLGGFITGSEASAIGMFGRYVLQTANNLGLDREGAILIAAALAFGSGLASVISPAKLQNAAASIDKLGEENKVIRVAFVFSIILTTVSALFAGILMFATK